MKSLKLIAATALIAGTMAAPVMARDYCDTHRCYHRGPVGAAADVAGGAVGAAAGIAQILFYVFLVIFLVVLVMNFIGRGRGPTI